MLLALMAEGSLISTRTCLLSASVCLLCCLANSACLVALLSVDEKTNFLACLCVARGCFIGVAITSKTPLPFTLALLGLIMFSSFSNPAVGVARSTDLLLLLSKGLFLDAGVGVLLKSGVELKVYGRKGPLWGV